MSLIDITGQRFGRLVALRHERSIKTDTGQHKTLWRCRCDCGNEKLINGARLRSGDSKSCGCAKTGLKPGADLGGIRTLDDLRLRCRIDPDTDCWRWLMGRNEDGRPAVTVRRHDGKKMKVRGRRAALYLARGADLPRGHVAWARLTCKSLDCVNPDHCRSGSRLELGAYLSKTGKSKSPAKTAAILRLARERLAKITLEDAREIRVSPESAANLARKYCVGESVIRKIKQGKAWREHLPGASVFSLALDSMGK